MKLRKRILTLATVAILAVSAMGVTAFAKEDKDGNILPDRIVIRPGGSKTLQKDKSIQLNYIIIPEDTDKDDDVTWTSSDEDIAEVDYNGYVTANGPGTCTIKVKTDNGKTSSLTIYVPGKGEQTTQDLDTDLSSNSESSTTIKTSSSSKSDSTTSSAVTAELTEKMPRETLISGVKSAGASSVTYENYASVSAESLQAAAAAGKGAVNFDTKAGKSVTGRLVITPANAAKLTGDINLGVSTAADKTKNVAATFDKYYSNTVKVVKCEQANYGMTVNIAVKFGSAKAENLHFYSYNATSNKLSELKNTSATIDSNNYVHFNTTVGGYIVVSDGVLAAK